MPNFEYVAKDQNGNAVNGALEGQDRKDAIEQLRKKNLVIVSMEEAKAKKKASPSFSFRKTAKLEDIVVFSRQLATMVDAGISLVSAFDILGEQAEKPAFKKILLKIRDDIQTGNSLSECFAKYPAVFSPLFVNMVKAGESSGMLDDILERLANYLEKTNTLIRKVKSALTYPAIITLMAISITIILLVKVVPVFEEIFAGFGADLPRPTMILIAVSNAIREYFIWTVGGVGLTVFALFKHIKTDKGRLAFDKLIFRLPIFGNLAKKVAISKFTRTFSTLNKSGVPILLALEIVGKTAGNKVVEEAVDKVRNNIREGESIAAPLSQSPVFPPMVVRMISVGEQTGQLEKMLTKIADFYDEQVDAAVSGLTSLIEPLIIAFLGIAIGGIVICMFLPIFKLTSVIQM